MPDIFISYAREDRARIEPMAEALGERGWSVFWDRNIPTGQTWRSHIGAALADARCVIVAWSQASVDSSWVSEEADDAKERGVLVPVFLDPVPPPIGFRSIQAADLTEWRAGRESAAFEQLVRDIHAIVGGSANHTQHAASKRRPARSRRFTVSGRTALLAGILCVGAFSAIIGFLSSGTPPAVRCDPLALRSGDRAQEAAGPLWLTFEELDCQDPEGFASGIFFRFAVDEPYIEVNEEEVWRSNVTCPSEPRIRLSIEPIELNPTKNFIVLKDSDAGGWSRDDLIGTVEIGGEPGDYVCLFEERFARYVLSWKVGRGEPE